MFPSKRKKLLPALLIFSLFASLHLKAEEPTQNIWTDFEAEEASNYQPGERPSPNRAFVSEPPSLPQGQAPDPFKIIEELNDPNAPPPKNNFLSGQNDPQGRDLERALPLDVPLTERQSDILDPIELDVNEESVLDLSIEKALLISLRSNLPQRIIDETVIRDKWRFWNTGSGLLPDGFLGYNAINRQGGTSFSPTTGTPINVGTNYIAQLGARYTLGPQAVFATIASYYDWMANSQFRGANLQDLMRRTVNQYYEVMRARGELAVRIEAVRQAQVQLALNQKLDQAGVGTKFAVLQAKQQLAENELALQSQQASARIEEVRLLTILNMPLGTDIRLEESQIMKRTLVSPDYEIGELVDLAYSHRPDITRRQYAFKAARQRVNQAVAGFTPNLTASYSINSFENTFGKSLEPRNLDTFKTGSLGLDWPVLTGLGLSQVSSINQRRAESRQAGLELQNERLEIENQVRDAFLRSKSFEKQILTAEDQVEAATEGIKLARIRLQNGVGTNIDLIDTQRNYVNALVSKVRAIAQYNQAQIDLLRSVGLISVRNITEGDLAIRVIDDFASEPDDGFQQAGYSKV